MRFLNVLIAGLMLAGTLVLGGCGYRPLYGSAANGGTVVAALSDVSVEDQKTRAGQLVRNNLVSGMGNANGGGRYVLRLDPAETSRQVSEVAGQKVKRFTYRLNVKYALVDSRSGSAVSEGASFSNVSYDTVEQPVADLQAANSAQSRAAQAVAEDIKTRIAAYLASGS